MSLLDRLLFRPQAPSAPPPPDPAPIALACAQALDEHLGEELNTRFSGLDEAVASLAEICQKSARGQGKLALRLEELERKVEGGFAAQAGRPAERAAPEFPGAADLLDAMDMLDGARAGLDDENAALREGLVGVLDRLGRALAAGGIERHAPIGLFFDARWFQVVGTVEADESRPDGTVVTVGRAAATHQGKVIREGEVVVARRQQ